MTRRCPQCGSSLLALAHPNRKYCSDFCANKTFRERSAAKEGKRKCVICGESFLPKSHDRTTCSTRCSRLLKSEVKKGFRNPAWKASSRKRPGRSERAAWDASLGSSCLICGSDDRLTLHHIIYKQHVRKRGGNEWDPRNGMTLCISCHSRQHSGTSFRILVYRFPVAFWLFGHDLLGDALRDYLARYYDNGNPKLKGLVSNV